MELVLEEAEKRDPMTKRECFNCIDRNVRDVRSFMLLIYLYWLKMSKKDSFLSHVYWRALYIDIGMTNGDIIIFKTWVASDPSSVVIQDSLYLLARVFPTLINKELIDLTEIELGAII